MKLIIAGTRTIRVSVDDISKYMKQFDLHPTEIVSGKEPNGVDACGEDWAEANGIRVKSFKANWSKFGLRAGPIRNNEMAKYADELLLIWNRRSRGSLSMWGAMTNAGKPVHEIIIGDET